MIDIYLVIYTYTNKIIIKKIIKIKKSIICYETTLDQFILIQLSIFFFSFIIIINYYY